MDQKGTKCGNGPVYLECRGTTMKVGLYTAGIDGTHLENSNNPDMTFTELEMTLNSLFPSYLKSGPS